MQQQNELTQIMTQKATLVGTVVHEVSSVLKAMQYAVDLNKRKNLKTITSYHFHKPSSLRIHVHNP